MALYQKAGNDMHAILLIFALLYGGNSGGTAINTTQIEFQTMEQCEKAARAVRLDPETSKIKPDWIIGVHERRAVCIEK